MLHITGQGQPTQEVGQVVSQGKQLQPRLVVFEGAAGELRPFHRVLPFFYPLLRRASTIVEFYDVFRVLVQVGHDKTDAREQLACVPFDLGDHTT